MANETMGRVMAFWHGRSQRERGMLAAAAGVVALGLFFGLVYAPLDRARDRLSARLPVLRAEQRLMTAQVAEIERLRGQGRAGAPDGAGLVRLVEASALAGGLRERIQSLTPAGDDGVRVLTQDGALDTWTRWLFELHGQGVRVRSCRIVAGKVAGQASLEVVLAGAGQP